MTQLQAQLQFEIEQLNNRLAYDAIARHCLLYASRPELQSSIDLAEAGVAEAQAKSKALDEAIEARLEDCRRLMTFMHGLADSISSDITKFN